MNRFESGSGGQPLGMKTRGLWLETLFLFLVIAVSVAGFWELYLGPGASPNGFHHLHLITSFAWLGLLLMQVRLMNSRRLDLHRQFGLAVVILGPLLVASTALLSVKSAARAIASGQADPLIFQNVGVTSMLGVLLLLSFVMIRRPRVHGAALLSSALLFMGIALVFALVSFMPAFRIEGPETFHRFALAALSASGVVLVSAVVLFFRDLRNGWPHLLVAAYVLLSSLLGGVLTDSNVALKLTRSVGGWNPYLAFAVTFGVLLASLLMLGLGHGRSRGRKE